jgi:hypothetical protein
VLQPRQPFPAHDAHDVRERPGTFLAPFLDRHQADPLSMPERALHRAHTHASAGGNLADGSGAAASVPVLVCDDAHDGHLARRELVGEV